MKNLLLMLAGAATICFYGCDNDDDDANVAEPTASRTEMISSTDWTMDSAILMEGGQTVDMMAEQPATSQDDVFIFEENGEAIREEGETKEMGAEDVVDTGTWSFMNEEKDLKVDLQSISVNDEIVELTKDRLIVRNFDGESQLVTTFIAE